MLTVGMIILRPKAFKFHHRTRYTELYPGNEMDKAREQLLQPPENYRIVVFTETKTTKKSNK